MLIANLDVHLRIRLEVAIPPRVAVASTEGCGQYDATAVAQIERRRGPWLAGLATFRGNQGRREPQQPGAEPAVGAAIHPDVCAGEVFQQQRQELGITNPAL